MYVELHLHTCYSLLDGAGRIEDMVSRAKELGMGSLAITDHGNMFGVIKFYDECKKQGIKPIVGCEVYTAKSRLAKDRERSHLILLAKNMEGYQNLIKIVSNAYLEGFYYKPRTDLDYIREHSSGLICMSACLAGDIAKRLRQDDIEGAAELAEEYHEIFGDDYYLEIQNHNLQDDKKVIPGLKMVSEMTGIPIVCTNDVHYVKKEDAEVQEILLCISTGKTLAEDHLTFEGEEYYLKSEKEMLSMFPEEYVNRSIEIADKCNVTFEFGNYHVPKFDPETGESEDAYFEKIAREGFLRRYPNQTEEEKAQFEHELAIIRQMGYVGYFLIVQDFINWAKDNGITVGPGRGSAAGSMIAYCIGITEVDPMRYGLVFERFLNPERVSAPDIDTDFEPRRRHEVVEYVTRKYGAPNVCQISTITTMGAKRAIKDIAKVYGVPYDKSDALTKMIGDDPKTTLSEAMNGQLGTEYQKDKITRQIVDMALRMEGLPRDTSTHAAGVVIAPKPVDEFVPLAWSAKTGAVTMYTMEEIERLGLLKFDFLGLANLSVIEDCCKAVGLDISTIPYDDPKVFETISSGDTIGVFQLEGKGITNMMRELHPTCFEDISAGIALYRPGPMDFIPEFIENKNNPRNIHYATPDLKPILESTYGCVIYQEEVMQIVRDLAGYSMGRSDLIRKAMSKKKADVMAKEKEIFIHGTEEVPGCIKKGISAEVASKLWEDMTSFAAYAFNKSHSVAYAMITYQTAYLKTHYPVEYIAALMTGANGNHEKIRTYMGAARNKVKILPPNVMKSKEYFTAEGNNVRMGLSAIRGIGTDAAKRIVEMEKPKDLATFLRNLNESKSVIEGLMYSGALSCYENMATVEKNYKKFLTDGKTLPGQLNLFSMIDDQILERCEEYPKAFLLEKEKEYTGIYISGHPLDEFSEVLKSCTKAEDILQSRKGTFVRTAGTIKDIRQRLTKRGDAMAFVLVETLDGEFEVIAFPETFSNAFHLLTVGAMIAIDGRTDDGKVIAKQIYPITLLQPQDPTLKIKARPTDELLSILKEFPGKDTVLFFFDGKAHKWNRGVRKGNLLLIKLRLIVGNENVK